MAANMAAAQTLKYLEINIYKYYIYDIPPKKYVKSANETLNIWIWPLDTHIWHLFLLACFKFKMATSVATAQILKT
jgi:hypothetical protein